MAFSSAEKRMPEGFCFGVITKRDLVCLEFHEINLIQLQLENASASSDLASINVKLKGFRPADSGKRPARHAKRSQITDQW
jgi:hypothetical protein